MSASTRTRGLFLWCVAAIYLFAFISLYFQIPGLFGKNGLLPARLQLLPGKCHDDHEKCRHWAKIGECKSNPSWMFKSCELSCDLCKEGQEYTLLENIARKPTLLWLASGLGLDIETCMELLCVTGAALCFASLLFGAFRNGLSFVTMWALYFSLYQVGQTFLWFQWDILLLEVGFLTVFVSPWYRRRSHLLGFNEDIFFMLARWMLFRLMFASGVVKLTSQCPTWWGLTALNWHYESQCIPTPLAWYAHQLPDWFQKLSVALTFLIEIALPFLFFAPVRSLRLFSFYSQVFLQVLIILTGNYNFFNLLTIALCLSLLDDRYLWHHAPESVRKCFLSPEICEGDTSLRTRNNQRLWGVVATVLAAFVGLSILYWTVTLFDMHYDVNQNFRLQVGFSKAAFANSLKALTPLSIMIGAASLSWEIGKSFSRCLVYDAGKVEKVWNASKTVVASLFAAWLFCISLVPYTDVDKDSQDKLWPVFFRWHRAVDEYQLVNSYGLFRRMTGVGGRPELIIEGANNMNGPWKEYEFLYKPGRLNRPPPYVAPHQPRLDWQMWFAALGSYHQNPWYVHLIYKLLHGEEDVLNLLGRNPFPSQPPKFIRSKLYLYHYTKLPPNSSTVFDGLVKASGIKNWWYRDSESEYTPALTKDEPSVKQFLNQFGLAQPIEDYGSGILFHSLSMMRGLVQKLNPTLVMLLLFLLPGIIIALKHYLSGCDSCVESMTGR